MAASRDDSQQEVNLNGPWLQGRKWIRTFFCLFLTLWAAMILKANSGPYGISQLISPREIETRRGEEVKCTELFLELRPSELERLLGA
jgi:hypothetical protein